MGGDIEERAKRIRALYREFLFKLFRLEKKEDDMIRALLTKRDESKLKSIRQRIQSK
jgi:hypothetical protein